jgi:hypothetical protein
MRRDHSIFYDIYFGVKGWDKAYSIDTGQAHP